MANNKKKNRGKKEKKDTKPVRTEKVQDEPEEEDSSKPLTLKGIMKQFPFTWITILIFIPKLVRDFYCYAVLQEPGWLAMGTFGLLSLRPAVGVTDPRQVLILGSISSGTTQVTYDMKQNLKLEIGHEIVESSKAFVRDGTVSWFHAIRYLPKPQDEDIMDESLRLFCQKLTKNMGFHPAAFRKSTCGDPSVWSPCWQEECSAVITSEWGCALDDSCPTPFKNVLHQVRRPLDTIESLVKKFCINGVEGEVAQAFYEYNTALFPQYDFSEMSCTEAAGYYVYAYNKLIMNQTEYNIPMYRIEEVTTCDVAKLSGFDDKDTAIYPKNVDSVVDICNNKPDAKANQILRSTKNTYNPDDENKIDFDWFDLLGGVNGNKGQYGKDHLKNLIQELTQEMGYKEEEAVEKEEEMVPTEAEF